jgi:hypothetical protein
MLKPESFRHTSYSLSSLEPFEFRQVPCRMREQGIYLLYLPVLLDKRVCSSNQSSSTTAQNNLFFFFCFLKRRGERKEGDFARIVTARLITSHLITPHQSLLITISHLERSASQCASHVPLRQKLTRPFLLFDHLFLQPCAHSRPIQQRDFGYSKLVIT